MRKFVIEVWLKCIETTTTKKVIRFYGEKNCGGPTKTAVNPALPCKLRLYMKVTGMGQGQKRSQMHIPAM